MRNQRSTLLVSSSPIAETIVKKGGTSYIFVTDGIEAALERARQATGSQDVHVNGGADVGRQFLNAGLLDEIRPHLAPIILGTGTRLFDGVSTDVQLVPREAQDEPEVTHLIYDVERPTAELWRSDRRRRPAPLRALPAGTDDFTLGARSCPLSRTGGTEPK